MAARLATPIALYIAAENRGDAEAMAQCFAENAVVRDEGKTIKGLDAIKQWKAETKKKYQHTVEPLASVQKGDKTVVTNRLTGNFPGSPIELQFIFKLDGDKIASLEIRSRWDSGPIESDACKSNHRHRTGCNGQYFHIRWHGTPNTPASRLCSLR